MFCHSPSLNNLSFVTLLLSLFHSSKSHNCITLYLQTFVPPNFTFYRNLTIYIYKLNLYQFAQQTKYFHTSTVSYLCSHTFKHTLLNIYVVCQPFSYINYLPKYPSIYLNTNPSTYLSTYLPVRLSIYFLTYLSTYLSIYLSIHHHPIYPSTYLSTFPSIYLSTCPSLSLYLHVFISTDLSTCLSTHKSYSSIYPNTQLPTYNHSYSQPSTCYSFSFLTSMTEKKTERGSERARDREREREGDIKVIHSTLSFIHRILCMHFHSCTRSSSLIHCL